ncbi:MAG: hypothetical protein JXJ04_00615 [Spirochaetales bacterium]|nr:hypothetical protein [Spirochaetales bacterium]
MILVFDIGTTIIKGGIIDMDGTLVAHSRLPMNPPGSPILNDSGASIMQWTTLFADVSKQCIREYRASGSGSGIQGVVVSGNGPTFIPVDATGKPLCGALSWADKQSRDDINLLTGLVRDQVNPAYYLSKAYYLFKTNHSLYEKVRWFLPCPEYFSYFLTGNACAILPTAGFTRYMWTHEAIDRTGMDHDKFPPFVSMGEEIGKVKKEIGELTGIPPGIPVFAGGPDFIMSLLGTSTIEPGRVCDRTGTSEGINLCSKTLCSDDAFFTVPHIRPGLFHISCILPFAGKAGDWFLKLTNKNMNEYKKLYSLLSRLSPGPEKLLFLPHLEQPRSGVWSGYRKGMFVGLTLEHQGQHLFKAITEGIGYAVQEVFELFEEKGFNPGVVRVSGIQASYKVWNTIRANILGKRIHVPVIWDTELTGAACIGFASIKGFSDVFEASEHLVRLSEEYLPDKDIHNRYRDMYHHYKELYKQTDSVLRDLS